MSLSRARATRARAKQRVTDEDELYQTSCIKRLYPCILKLKIFVVHYINRINRTET